MLERLIEWDKELLVFLNSFHTPWLDPVMLLITKTAFWIPLYAFLIYLMFRNFKRETWFILLGVTITIVLCDQITSTFMKPFFARSTTLTGSYPGRTCCIMLMVTKEVCMDLPPGMQPTRLAWHCLFGSRCSQCINGLVGFSLWAALMTYTRIYLGCPLPR
jgi:undecaprenyl-diphosphatase